VAVHGAFKSKQHAKEYAEKARKKGLMASPYKKSNGKWYVSTTR